MTRLMNLKRDFEDKFQKLLLRRHLDFLIKKLINLLPARFHLRQSYLKRDKVPS